MQYKNLGEMFFHKRKIFADKTAYMYKTGDQWTEVSFKQAVDRSEKISSGFASLGIKKGDRIALISNNRMDWALIDYACLALGAMLVPVYPSLLPEQVNYILNDCEAKIVIVEDEIQKKKVDDISASLPFANNFFLLDSDDKPLDEPWKSLDQLIGLGENFLKNNPDFVMQAIDKVGLDDWATLIYTSGTTGEPKGAILTHGNFLHNIEDATSVLDVYSEDIFLSFLPLSHVFERMAGHFLSCYHGCTVAYAESVDTVAANLTEIRPTVMVSVPRLYEKIYARVLENVEAGPPAKRKIFYWSIKVGREYIHKVINKQAIPMGLKLRRQLAYKLVFGKLYERVGGRIRFFVSGGAPLSAEIAEFFGAAGIKILEGYGLTETSPVIAVNLEHHFKFGTVGPVLPGVEVKIAEDGEILTRGHHVMVGYFKKEAETRDAIDEEGWFHTGDIGLIDEDGFLKITDRKKNLIVTSGGKNIAPQPIENALVTSKYIDQVVVIGDKRKFCTALIVPSEEPLAKWAADNNKSFSDFKELIHLDGVRELIADEINGVNSRLASYETIKDFVLVDRPFSIESGELTPSLKVKRNVVEKNYIDQIEKMYQV